MSIHQKVDRFEKVGNIDVSFRVREIFSTKEINNATINWPACGSVSIEEAEAFLQDLQGAIALAKSFLV